MCSDTVSRLEARQNSAEDTLADIRSTLAKWDKMKADFGNALDGAIRRIAEGMVVYEDHRPVGSPTGRTAHGYLSPVGLDDPLKTLDCEEEARPKMQNGIPSHEYRDSPAALRAKVALLAELLRRADGRTAVYTGAGISTGANW